jgi:hypothetical protein
LKYHSTTVDSTWCEFDFSSKTMDQKKGK